VKLYSNVELRALRAQGRRYPWGRGKAAYARIAEARHRDSSATQFPIRLLRATNYSRSNATYRRSAVERAPLLVKSRRLLDDSSGALFARQCIRRTLRVKYTSLIRREYSTVVEEEFSSSESTNRAGNRDGERVGQNCHSRRNNSLPITGPSLSLSLLLSVSVARARARTVTRRMRNCAGIPGFACLPPSRCQLRNYASALDNLEKAWDFAARKRSYPNPRNATGTGCCPPACPSPWGRNGAQRESVESGEHSRKGKSARAKRDATPVFYSPASFRERERERERERGILGIADKARYCARVR